MEEIIYLLASDAEEFDLHFAALTAARRNHAGLFTSMYDGKPGINSSVQIDN